MSRRGITAAAIAAAAIFGIGLASASSLRGERDPIANQSDAGTVYVESEVVPVTTTSVTAGPTDLDGGFPCPLLGRTAAAAETYFSGIGITVEWAFESPVSPEGDGYRSTPDAVPMNSIVMDVSRVDARTVVVGVHAADDLTHTTTPPKRDKDC